MSSDAVAAALVGALVETLGYIIRFSHRQEDPAVTLRRERPDIAMLDGSDATMISEVVLGHAAMLDIAVVVYGPREALDELRAVAHRHRIHTLLSPPSRQDVAATLTAALGERGGASAGGAR